MIHVFYHVLMKKLFVSVFQYNQYFVSLQTLMKRVENT